MYFIVRGKVRILSDTDNTLNILEDGAYFGEICLLTDDRRTATVQALTACDLCTLTKVDFEKVIEEFPELRTVFEEKAIKRLSRLGVVQLEPASDEGPKIVTSIPPPNISSRKSTV